MLLHLLLATFTIVYCKTNVIASECSKAAKVETYLETAAEIIDKLRENLPDGEGNCDCPQKPMDCSELVPCGYNASGIYKIWPRNRIMNGPIDVYCDMTTEGGGWTVIQRRGDYKRPKEYFFRNWHKYKTGFGDLRKDFWLGNDNIYALTNQDKYYLLFDITDFNNTTRNAFYDQFWIDSEDQQYRLHVYDYSGDAGDSFANPHNGQMFSTMDKDNDNSTEHCAQKFMGGWWYENCYGSNLNGLYYTQKSKTTADILKGITWGAWKGSTEILKNTEMKIRPSDFRMHLLDMDIEPV